MESTLSDKELVLKTINGLNDGFEQLVKRYSGKLYFFIFNRTSNREDTEDIIQETFLKAYRNLSKYDPKWQFSTWIYTIASRTAVSHFRHKNISYNNPLMEVPAILTPEEELLKTDINNIWFHARKLGKSKFEILWLRYNEGMTLKEIGKVINKSPVNTRVTLHRAKTALTKILIVSDESNNIINGNMKKNLV